MSKYFSSNDINFVTNTVHRIEVLDSGSDGIKTVAFSSGSDNTDSSSYYNVLNHLFYKKHHYGGNGTFTGTGVLYPYSQENVNPQYKNKFNKDGVLLSISSSYYGRRIKPGTFVYTDTSNSHSITIKDDGYGNLYPTNAVLSQSSATSISSSDNYVGNIFYEHGISVITETGSYNSAGVWNLDSASLETESPSMVSENNLPQGIWFKPDGTRYFMAGSQGGKEGVYEYSMSTPWDVSTATYTGNYHNLAPHYVADAWRSVSFNPDGTKMFLTNQDSDQMKAFDLDIGWDLSSFDESDYGSIETFDLDDGEKPFKEQKVKGHYFREDGLKLYIVGETNNSAIEYNLSSAFDLTSIGGVSQSYDISSSVAPYVSGDTETEINGIHFSTDGYRMYTGGNDKDNVYEHRLSTAWDVTTATYETKKSISSEETQIHDVQWKPDGSKMYIVGHGTDVVHQYNIPISSYTGCGVNYLTSYETTVDIHTYEYSCTLDTNEYNQTMNRTVLRDTASISHYYEDQSQPTIGSYDLTQFGVFPNIPGYQVSRSIVNLNNGVISSKFRKDSFRTYITKIGLFNDEDELIMMASLSTPLQKIIEHPMTIKIQIDF